MTIKKMLKRQNSLVTGYRMRERQVIKVKSLIGYIGKLGISIIVGMLLLIVVYTLPVQNMKANVGRSSDIFNIEGTYPQLSYGYKYTQLDNYTDSIMLGAAIYDGTEGIVNQAVNNYHIDSEQLPSVLALTNYANEVSSYEYYTLSYGRYWHGYLIPLKLLLLFFDYSDIRILNFFLQNILLFIVLRLFNRNHLEQYVPAFLITVFLINPMTAAVSLQFSAVYYIILLSNICLLCLAVKGKAEEAAVNQLFFITGILTSYFDLLTYPFATCGILAVLYLVLNRESMVVASVKLLFQKILLWTAGYGGMWSGKWLVGSILIRDNLFQNALSQALVRTSQNVGGGANARLLAVVQNISVFLKWPFLIMFLLGAGFFVFWFRKLNFRILWKNKAVTIFLIAVAMLPVGWIFVMANHSYLHYWFTYKEFAVSCFALLSLATYLKSLVCGGHSFSN